MQGWKQIGDVKLSQEELKVVHLLTTRYQFVFFHVTSCVEIVSARSAFCQTRQLSYDGIGMYIQGSWI